MQEHFYTLVSGRSRGVRATLLRGLLRLASVPYGWATCLRNRLFDRGWKRTERVAVSVVSVGNLTLGGTGKTPCVEYVCRFYRGLDVYTHGARIGEGYGIVLAEAMASRLPVVTVATPQRKKCNAQAEVVEHNLTGFVVRYAWQYADAVIELLKNRTLRERLGERGYEKARDQFEASKLTRKLEALYTELMDTH